MSAMTALFWYLAVGSVCYVRMTYRMRPYKKYMLKFWSKAIPDFNPSVTNEFGNLFVSLVAWPMLVTNIRMFWSNKDITKRVKEGIAKLEKEEGL